MKKGLLIQVGMVHLDQPHPPWSKSPALILSLRGCFPLIQVAGWSEDQTSALWRANRTQCAWDQMLVTPWGCPGGH